MRDATYTTGDIARLLSVSDASVKKLMGRGDIKSWWVPPANRERRTSAPAVARYLAGQHDYRGFLRDGDIVPRRWPADAVAAIVAEADRIAESSNPRKEG